MEPGIMTNGCPRRSESPIKITSPEDDHWQTDGTCSYCGSISQEMFFEAIENGHELGPTDKSYKVYVKGLNVHGAGKFYFQHLDPDGRDQFIRLYNDKKLNIGVPGDFYVNPFFCKRVEA